METNDALRPGDVVTVTIWGPDGSRLYQASSSGYRSIETAVNEALSNASLEINPEDCTFEVTNQKSDVSHRYRINAHGHLKLIV